MTQPNDTESENTSALPEWLGRRVKVFQALKEKGLTLEEIELLTKKRANDFGWVLILED